MRPHPEHAIAGDELRLSFPGAEPALSFLEEAQSHRGFLLELSDRLKQFTPFTAVVSAPPAFRFRFAVEAVQQFPAAAPGRLATAFQLAGWGEAEDRRLESERRRLAGSDDDRPQDLTGSPIHRVKQLKVPERVRLAFKADRTERQILLRDTSPQVLEALLVNPYLEDDDVLQMIKSTYTTGAMLKRIAGHARWIANYEVLHALVRNPRTPTPIASKLLTSLRMPDLRNLAKGSLVRESLRLEALRIVERRKG